MLMMCARAVKRVWDGLSPNRTTVTAVLVGGKIIQGADPFRNLTLKWILSHGVDPKYPKMDGLGMTLIWFFLGWYFISPTAVQRLTASPHPLPNPWAPPSFWCASLFSPNGLTKKPKHNEGWIWITSHRVVPLKPSLKGWPLAAVEMVMIGRYWMGQATECDPRNDGWWLLATITGHY